MKSCQFSLGAFFLLPLIFLCLSTSMTVTGAEEQESREKMKVEDISSPEEPLATSLFNDIENKPDQIPQNMSTMIQDIFSFNPETQIMTYNFGSVPGWPYEKVYHIPLNEPYDFGQAEIKYKDNNMRGDFIGFLKFLVCFSFGNDCICVHAGSGVKMVSFPFEAKCIYTAGSLTCDGTTCNAYASCKKYLSSEQQKKFGYIFDLLFSNQHAMCQPLQQFFITNCVLGFCENDAKNIHLGSDGKCCSNAEQCFSGPEYSQIPNCPCAKVSVVDNVRGYCVVKY